MSRCPQPQLTWNPKKVLIFFLLCLMASALFFILKNQSPEAFWSAFNSKLFAEDEKENHPDKLLGGLLPEGFDEKSCRSRYESAGYFKGQKHQPSSHLISALRSYEALHKRCGPGTEAYNKTLEILKSGGKNSSTGCKYAVWMPRDGLGNQMITLASTFLYALLTKRVLLVGSRVRVSDLFCEPFPGTSWLVPPDFPIVDHLVTSFGKHSNMSYGNMLKNQMKNKNGSLIKEPYVYLHLAHDYDGDDQRFFCDNDQVFLQGFPWQILKSNVYFAPSLFLMPSFQEELNRLFPEKETVFHFLGRYLFHPPNNVWKAITTYYNDYLATSDEKIGIQVRIFKTKPDPFEHYKDQILSCVFQENLLPRIIVNQTTTRKYNNTKAVLVTSLSNKYYETLKSMYDENSTATGETVRVYQPSHEERQRFGKKIHDRKAWEEMYLLSLTDKLVTSSKSTFGYVAQSLGGMKPWILERPEDYKVSNPACFRALSMEPCFQAPPGYHDCKTRTRIDLGKIVPYVRHCEDMQWRWGLKLFGKNGEA